MLAFFDEEKGKLFKPIKNGSYLYKINYLTDYRNNIRTSVKTNDLLRIMAYYLALKVIRNNINHANGIGNDDELSKEDEEVIIKGLLSEFDIYITNKPSDILTVIYEGLSIA